MSKLQTITNFLNQDITPTRLGKKDLAFFCRQLAFFAEAGVSLTQITEVPSNKKIEKSFATLKAHVSSGHSLSRSLGQEKFPHLLCTMAQVGEQTGRLDVVLSQMENHYTKAHETQRELLGVLMYPALLLLAMAGVVGISLVYLLPSFTLMFQAQGVSLPPLTQFLIDVSAFLMSPWALVNFVGLVVAIALPLGLGWLDGLFFKLPIVKRFARLLLSARMSAVMALMMASGVPLMRVMDICCALFKNKHAKRQLVTARAQLATGHSVHQSFADTGLFHAMFLSLIKLGEETGNLTDALAKAAQYFEQEKSQRLNQLKKGIEPAITLVMGAVLLVIMLGIMLPTFSVMQVL